MLVHVGIKMHANAPIYYHKPLAAIDFPVQWPHFIGDSLYPGGHIIGAVASLVAGPECRLESVLDAAADAILVCTNEGGIVFFNKAGERMFGCAADTMIGGHVGTLLARDLTGVDGGRWSALFGSPGRTDFVTLRTVDGREFAGEVTVSPAPTSTGRYHLVIVREHASGAANNVASDLRAARASAMEELGATLAHKLNQPLTAVILYLQAIGRAYGRERAGSELPEKVVAILEKAVREAERASSFLQRIRQVNEPSGGHEGAEQQSGDVNQIVENVLDLGIFIDRRGVAIDRLLAPRLPPVRIDRLELQQALIALIRAALEAAGAANGIRLATQRIGDHVAVLADVRPCTARGENASNCAESTDGRRKYERDLAIARAIAHGHGGELTVDGDGRGRDTRFTLRLPLLRRAASTL